MAPQAQARVGLLVPSSNTVMEVDFARGLPGGVALHAARMYLEETTPAGESKMLDEFTIGPARDLGTAHPDVVVFGCTSAGALRGNDYDAELCDRIAQVAGAPVISTIRSVRDALAASGARRIGVITPYVDELNERIKASIEADGLDVARIAGLGITENFAIAGVCRDHIVDFASSVLGGAGIDLVFASCTNFPALDAMEFIHDRLGVPVETSNHAVLMATIVRLGLAAAA